MITHDERQALKALCDAASFDLDDGVKALKALPSLIAQVEELEAEVKFANELYVESAQKVCDLESKLERHEQCIAELRDYMRECRRSRCATQELEADEIIRSHAKHSAPKEPPQCTLCNDGGKLHTHTHGLIDCPNGCKERLCKSQTNN